MKDKKIARMIANVVFAPNGGDGDLFYAIQLFVERVALPQSIDSYTLSEVESYIRDALKRGTDHWDICSPDDTEVDTFADVEDGFAIGNYVVTIDDDSAILKKS